MLQQIIEAATPLILLLFGMLMTWIANAIVKRTNAGTAQTVALEIATVADTVVRATAQAFKTEGFAFTPEVGQKMKAVAIASAKDQLSKVALKHIEANSESVEVVVGRAVEAAVSKKNDGVAVDTAPQVGP